MEWLGDERIQNERSRGLVASGKQLDFYIFPVLMCEQGNTGKTPGVAALFSCAGSGEPDSSYV